MSKFRSLPILLVVLSLLLGANACSSKKKTAYKSPPKKTSPSVAPRPVKNTTSSSTQTAAPKGVVNVSGESQFKSVVLDSPNLVVVDFWATWCGPCRMISPVVEDMGKKYGGKVTIAKVDADRNRAIADRYKVKVLPTILYFKNGKLIDKIVGVESDTKSQIEQKVKSNM